MDKLIDSDIIENFSRETNIAGWQKVNNDLTGIQNVTSDIRKKGDILFGFESKAKEYEEMIHNKSVGFTDKMKARYEYMKLKNELVRLGILKNFFQGTVSARISEMVDIQEQKIVNLRNEMQEIKTRFAENEKQRYMQLPYNTNDIEQTFNVENLCKLSMSDYVAVLSRFPNEMITHATRQGVRDHTCMAWHTAGKGDIHNGMKGILEQGTLSSPLVAHSQNNNWSIEETVCNIIGDYCLPKIEKVEWTNKEKTYEERSKEMWDLLRALPNDDPERAKKWREIEEQFQDVKSYNPPTTESIRTRRERLGFLNYEKRNPCDAVASVGNFPPMLDKCAVHFGVRHVLHDHYGGETDNECFVVFPLAMAGSNYPIMRLCPTTNDINNKMWNDIAVLPHSNNGIPIESGIVFLPQNAKVDRQTGSKYKTVNRKPVKNDNGFELADNTVMSQEYWENFIKQKCQGINLKVVFYDVEDSPSGAIGVWKNQNGIPNLYDKNQVQKNEQYLNYLREKEIDENSVNNTIKKMVHFDKLESEINSHFDKLEKDPYAKDLLQKRYNELYSKNEIVK